MERGCTRQHVRVNRTRQRAVVMSALGRAANGPGAGLPGSVGLQIAQDGAISARMGFESLSSLFQNGFQTICAIVPS